MQWGAEIEGKWTDPPKCCKQWRIISTGTTFRNRYNFGDTIWKFQISDINTGWGVFVNYYGVA